MHVGVLLDENLNYVHIVFGSIDFINKISDGKILKKEFTCFKFYGRMIK